MASGPPRDDVGEDNLRVTAPKGWAAGMPGVVASVRALRAQMSATKATRTSWDGMRPQASSYSTWMTASFADALY